MDAGVLRRALALAGTALALTAAPAGAEIVADSGFRPQPDGFSFANYGPGYANLNAAEMQRIYGRKVCLAGKGAKCVLRPTVRARMRSINKSMAGGHCYGFAVLSTVIKKGLLPRFGYASLEQLGGGPTTWDVPLEGNRKVQRSIARAFYFQALPSVNRAAVQGKPSRVVNALREELRSGAREGWTLTVFDRDGTGGHAVTPYALDDLGGGKYEILVYDNNWPGDERRVEVDTVAETWKYALGEEGSDWVWEGDAQTRTLGLHPVRPGLGVQSCDLCQGRAGLRSKYNEVTLDGAGVEHAHLILRDKQGRRTGIIGGELVREIPGVQVVPRTSGGAQIDADGEEYMTSLEPLYRVPKGKRVQVVVDARHLEARERQTLSVVGPTFDATAQQVVLDPGERARFVLAPRRERLAYAPAAASRKAVVRFGAEARARKNGRTRAAYEIEVSARGLPEGATVDFRKRPRLGLLRFGHDAKRRARVRYRVQITEFSRKGKRERAKRFTLTGRERVAFLHYGALGAKLGKPRVIVYDERGKRLRRAR